MRNEKWGKSIHSLSVLKVTIKFFFLSYKGLIYE